MRKNNPTRNVSVCLVSPHPLVLAEWMRQLSPAGFELQPLRIESSQLLDTKQLSFPDARVFVVDSQFPRRTMEVLITGIQQSRPGARQVVVTEDLSEANAFPLLRLGAKGLLSYSETHQRLPQVVTAVAAGGFWVARDLLSRFIDSNLESTHTHHRPPGPANLSHREQEVLEVLLENRANKEIADKLHISERTVKFHVSSLLEKFRVRRRSDLILLCLQEHPSVL
jgi:DNA-binding NarL/FixJ family response regulator